MLMSGVRRRRERSSRAAFTLVVRVALAARIDEIHRSAGGAIAGGESVGYYFSYLTQTSIFRMSGSELSGVRATQRPHATTSALA